jgi:hypothetical protein
LIHVLLPLHLGYQPKNDCPRRLVLLQVDQEFAEGSRLWVAPELADPLDPVEAGRRRTWMSSARAAGGKASRRARSATSISSMVMAER